MNTFIVTAFLLSNFAVNFAHGSEASEPDSEYEYNMDRQYEAEEFNNYIVRNISARTQMSCRPWYNQKIEAQVWLCPTNTFVDYASEETCKHYCW